MKISQLYTYPIKSLRPTPLTEALATKHGFPYDRRFMLLKVHADGVKNMHVSEVTEMSLFTTDIRYPEDDPHGIGAIYVTFNDPGTEKSRKIEVPLLPGTSDLEEIAINMHNSPAKGYKMPCAYQKWFSSCFGYEVLFVYLGQSLREVGFESMKAPKSNSWLSSVSSSIPYFGSTQAEEERITFADCATYLVVSEVSLKDVSSRLPDGEQMDITKFRPNIVVDGADSAWEEDYWARIQIGESEVSLKENCVRCASINVDYATGKPGKGESGTVLKKLQKDRRVDKGAKWSPVFGRYGFLASQGEPKPIKIGDEVTVIARNSERTVWSWPGLS